MIFLVMFSCVYEMVLHMIYISTRQKVVIAKLGEYLSTFIALLIQTRPRKNNRTGHFINFGDVKLTTLEIVSEKTCNTIINVIYRPPNTSFKLFENFLTTFFLNKKIPNKNIHIAADFNHNLLDYDNNKKVQTFLNLIYQNNSISPIFLLPTSIPCVESKPRYST